MSSSEFSITWIKPVPEISAGLTTRGAVLHSWISLPERTAQPIPTTSVHLTGGWWMRLAHEVEMSGNDFGMTGFTWLNGQMEMA
jgi:hypothetical protein